MPLQTIEKPQSRKDKEGKKWSKKRKAWTVIIVFLCIPFLIFSGLLVKTYFDNKAIEDLAGNYQSQKSDGPIRIKKGNAAYDPGEALPSAKQLEKYHNQKGYLYHRGYMAVPKQKGVTIPINSIQINEGSTDPAMQNKAMATGAVTAKSRQVMGENNFGVAAHSCPDGRKFFSPMQRGIDVNQQPKVYLTDGSKIYIYQLNKGVDDGVVDALDTPKQYDDPGKIPGRRVINMAHGNVIEDDVAKGKSILTMYTCDEPNRIFNLQPVNRIVMTGQLVDTINFADASQAEKALFPQLN